MNKIRVALITIAFGMGGANSAYAHDSVGISLNIGAPAYYDERPAYYDERPVYYAPEPAYYGRPAVIIPAAPVYYVTYRPRIHYRHENRRFHHEHHGWRKHHGHHHDD